MVVAAPVAQVAAQVRAALEASGEETTVTDVGSTKSGGRARRPAARRASSAATRSAGRRRAAPSTRARSSSTEQPGFSPRCAETDPDRYRLVHGFVSALGATPVAVDPQAHDRLVALTSHLPHALANLLVNQAGATRVEGHEPLAAAGGSLRDMTRVAGANPRIWVDIFLENAASLRESLAEHRRRVEQLEAALDAGDAGFLARWIGEAAGNRRRMLADAYPGSGRAAAAARPRARPARRARGDHAGARRGADQHRGLRAAPRLARPRRDADAARHRRRTRPTRAAELLESQGYGVVVSPVLAE